MTKKDNVNNMERCPRFKNCSHNLCPLDYDLEKRTKVKRSDECPWIRTPRKKKVKGKEFISGGRAMPDKLLKHVPEKNFESLNKSSQKRWSKLHN